MTPEQITTIISTLFGYGVVALSIEKLRKDFIAYKKEQAKEHASHKERLDALEQRA